MFLILMMNPGTKKKGKSAKAAPREIDDRKVFDVWQRFADRFGVDIHAFAERVGISVVEPTVKAETCPQCHGTGKIVSTPPAPVVPITLYRKSRGKLIAALNDLSTKAATMDNGQIDNIIRGEFT